MSDSIKIVAETQTPEPSREHRPPRLFLAAAIVAVTFIAYFPAILGGVIWDDDIYVTRNLTLRSLEGLGQIWFKLGATPQYYPLVHSTFWVEYHLWGPRPLGFHIVNVMLHGFNAVLVGLALDRLRLRGAWIAAAIFALHPVHVESVAWITERKNVLSGFFYLMSLLAYLRFSRLDLRRCPERRDGWAYGAALVLFVLALLSKTVSCMLPAGLLILTWLKRDRLTSKDLQPLIPFFILGAAMGLLTAWMEKYHLGGTGQGAQGPEWDFSFLDRCLIAGRALWFYPFKLLLPLRLTFIYPRWEIDSGNWANYIYPAAAAAAFILLFLMRRRIGKGPLAAALFFAATVFPALGFLNIYPMRYSFVADHFQYLASLGPIALFASAFSNLRSNEDGRDSPLGHHEGRRSRTLMLLLLTGLAVLTWRQGKIYHDQKILWADTLAKNPRAWIAHHNLGSILLNEGDLAGALEHLSVVLENKPQYPEVQFTMGLLHARMGSPSAAIGFYNEAIALEPDYANAYNAMGVALAKIGKDPEAISAYQKAHRIEPDHVLVWINLGSAYQRLGQYADAIQSFDRALELNPDRDEAHNGLGVALANQGKSQAAIRHFTEALRLNPKNKVAQSNLKKARENQFKSGNPNK